MGPDSGGGFAFLGCTLWTDFQLASDPQTAMRVAEDIMSDYQVILTTAEHRRLRAEDTARLYVESVAWLSRSRNRVSR